MNKGLKILKWTTVCLLFVLLFGFVTMSLWNWLVPFLFNGPIISFWQALGLLLLSKILLGGFGGRRWGGYGGGMHWKHRYYNKLSGMSPQEREQFKAKVWQKWCSREEKTSPGQPGNSNV